MDSDFIEKIYKFLKTIGNFDREECERQRKYYIQKYTYTNEGIYKALKYYYNVMNASFSASQGRIGIVPYIYHEARKYYKTKIQKTLKLKQAFEQQLEIKNVVVKKNVKQIKTIDLDSIRGDDI